ncbi:excalibur calcium-binding domain-containing protein [Nocardioides KLBMP 9356]|uniref:Excalibur calcium-binding domain-containing protein n=1 Tax=Nocardioides potassii TaxID=2911371 RepID=A0ABS9H9V8_9ACTN|nr:excalibur calcium-binding domain-containing protein [Nocardioides potassii]MCF6377996.1 excalibur calcium-binding domain-containing protein [Nocardioides potassii]
MRRTGLLLAFAATALAAQLPTAHAQTQAKDVDCADFPSQQAAQLFYLNHSPSADPNNLDSDGDGVVCESLGGPYYYGSDPTPGNNNSQPQPPKPKPIKVVKVLAGDLLKLRQGTDRPFNVRLLGAQVRGTSCITAGARDDLRSWINPGLIVSVKLDKTAPKRDKQGNILGDVIADRANVSIGAEQVKTGWATPARYQYKNKARYQKWTGGASYHRHGMYGACIANNGSEANPYIVGTAFDLGPWRYQVGATDADPLPEMQAEAKAKPSSIIYGTVSPGWVYVRVPVTVTNLGAGTAAPNWVNFSLARGDERYRKLGPGLYDYCGGGDAYMGDKYIPQGQTMTLFVCATIPGALQPTDTWNVDADDFSTERFVKVI